MINIKVHYLVYSVLLGLMLGWLAASVAGSFFVRMNPLPLAKIKVAERPVPPLIAAEEIINKNIFGLELRPSDAPIVSNTGIVYGPDGNPIEGGQGEQGMPPPPPFNAKLLGVLKDMNGKNGIAIIMLDAGTFSIRLGGEKEGIKVVTLDDFSAIVENDMKKYTLVLDLFTQAQKPGQATPPAANSNAPQIIQSGPNINIKLNKAEVQTELKDLNKILQSAFVSPFYNAGEFQGYRVMRMREDSPLVKLGLQPGDVIARLNGNELKSPELLFSMLSQIDDISAISVDIIRNNEKKTLFVEIQ